MSSNLHLIAVDQVLGITKATTHSEYINAFNYTLLWSQRVAQQCCNTPYSQTFFENMRNELCRVAWIADDVSTQYYMQTGSTFSPASSIIAVFHNLLGSDASYEWIDQFFSSVQLNNMQNDENELLNFLWSKSQTQNQTILTISPIQIDSNKRMSAAVVRFTFDFIGDEWKSLFVKSSSKQFFVSCYSFKMIFNFELWDKFKDDLEAKLVNSANKYIQEVDLKF